MGRSAAPRLEKALTATRYHEPAAQDTRRRIVGFFGKHLKT
jgi:hypothetical protein